MNIFTGTKGCYMEFVAKELDVKEVRDSISKKIEKFSIKVYRLYVKTLKKFVLITKVTNGFKVCLTKK